MRENRKSIVDVDVHGEVKSFTIRTRLLSCYNIITRVARNTTTEVPLSLLSITGIILHWWHATAPESPNSSVYNIISAYTTTAFKRSLVQLKSVSRCEVCFLQRFDLENADL